MPWQVVMESLSAAQQGSDVVVFNVLDLGQRDSYRPLMYEALFSRSLPTSLPAPPSSFSLPTSLPCFLPTYLPPCPLLTHSQHHH